MRPHHPLHPYHLVGLSPWPLFAAIGAFNLAIGVIAFFHLGTRLGLTRVLLLFYIAYLWWRDVTREALLGYHTLKVQQGLKLGIILFILSEAMFFFAFFWAFFHSSLAPTPEIGCCWPPYGIAPLNPFATPLLNTAVLLASGVTLTWAHHRLLDGDKNELCQALVLTISLGAYFSWLQLGEYQATPFGINDSIYGSIFFVATGFHGLHVLVGTIFLTVCWYRARHDHFSTSHHIGIEAAIWYWHFVDVVWILLYISIYWWGSLISK